MEIDLNLFQTKKPDKRNLTVFASSRDIQTSLESPKWGNGAFSKALKKNILCGNAAVNGEITLKDLNVNLSYDVKQITGNKQNPDAVGLDYPLVIAKEILPKDSACD